MAGGVVSVVDSRRHLINPRHLLRPLLARAAEAVSLRHVIGVSAFKLCAVSAHTYTRAVALLAYQQQRVTIFYALSLLKLRNVYNFIICHII